MIKRITAAAMILAAVLLCACGNPNKTEPTPSPTPDAFAALRNEIAAYADAEVTEAGGALLITLDVSGADEAQAAAAFFEQAEILCVNYLRDTEYSEISFTMSVNGEAVGAFYIMMRESAMVALPPTAYNESYVEVLENAFLGSGFAYGEEW